jgi:hypothetical protein
MTDIQSTLDAIDDVAVQECGWCRSALDENGPSADFCSAICQTSWTQRKHEVDELVGYREPIDLPAHVANQVEMSSPEVTPESACSCGLCLSSVAPALVQRLRERRGRGGVVWAPDGAVIVGPVLGVDPAGDRIVRLQVRPDTAQLRDAMARFASQFHIQLTDWQRRILEAVDSARALRQALTVQVRQARTEEPPAEPTPAQQAMQRALELRRNRNTGPTRNDRAPRRLDARGNR